MVQADAKTIVRCYDFPEQACRYRCGNGVAGVTDHDAYIAIAAVNARGNGDFRFTDALGAGVFQQIFDNRVEHIQRDFDFGFDAAGKCDVASRVAELNILPGS